MVTTTLSKDVFLEIPATSEFVGVVRLAVSGIATRMNFSVEDIEDIKIAISEACTNAVQHAYDGQEPGRITIKCEMTPDYLGIIVEDKGNGFDLGIIGSDEQKKSSTKKLGLGLGITFIKSLMSDAEIISEPGKGTIVRMKKNNPNSTSLSQ